MAKVYNGRYTAQIEGDFVVFLIGMRVNKVWKLNKWIPVARGMRPMLKALFGNPEKGMLGARPAWIGWAGGGGVLAQLCRSRAVCEKFRDPHKPAWKRFNQNIGTSGDVGIWHETFKVHAGDYECLYGNMPRVGLAAAGEHLPVGRNTDSAAQRIGEKPLEETAEAE